MSPWSRWGIAVSCLVAWNSCALIDAAGEEGSGGPEVLCLDGMDNDDDGDTDCEDSDCNILGTCFGSGFGEEMCDGVDQTGSLFPGVVDELGCACVDDRGCDKYGMICAMNIGSTADNGTCAPLCTENDYCEEFGGPGEAVCVEETGLCDFLFVSPL